jgi:hypothetical protein
MLIDKLLSLETEELLSFKFTEYNFLIWPFIRKYILENIYIKITNSSIPGVHREKLSLFENISYSYNTLKYNPFKYSNYPIVFLLTQIAVSLKKDGKYFNRLHDYFALEYPESSLIIEKSERRKYKLSRYFCNIAFDDYMFIKPLFKSMFIKPRTHDLINIKKFIECLNKQFKDHLKVNDLKIIYNNLIKYTVLAPLLYKNYLELFKKLKPSIIILYAASRGREKVCIVKAAKDLHIKVTEFQHGAITKSHPIYNYSECIFKSLEYREYLPDYLLTWGEFWNSNMRHPSNKITIGNPDFETKLEEYKSIKNHKLHTKKVILIISQGTLTKTFVELTESLSKKIDNNKFKIIYKLHPGEVPFKERYKKLYSLNNVEINKSDDIYNLLFYSDYVVGCYSTTIYEALGFKKPIFILDNQWSREYIPEGIGYWFKSVDELCELVRQDNTRKTQANEDIGYYWEMDWRKRYRDFIENEIKLNKP